MLFVTIADQICQTERNSKNTLKAIILVIIKHGLKQIYEVLAQVRDKKNQNQTRIELPSQITDTDHSILGASSLL